MDSDARVEVSDWLSFAEEGSPESVDFLYADPPFNTGREQVSPAGGEAYGRILSGSYSDAFGSGPEFTAWLRARVTVSVPLLRPTALVALHVDWRTSHHVRLMLDDVLGEDRFVNHLIWSYGLGGSSPRRFARKHDDILLYCVDPERYYFDPPRVPATSQRMKGQTKKMTDVIEVSDVLKVASINNMAAERTGYPTQKPIELLRLLVRACCPVDGRVMDPCCGSGTTLVAAAMEGRGAIGCDVNPEAVRIAQERLTVEATARVRRGGNAGGASDGGLGG